MEPSRLTASQKELLLSLPTRFPPSTIDALWVFAPMSARGRESGFLVLSLLESPSGGADPAIGESMAERSSRDPGAVDPSSQRALVTVRYEAEQVNGRLRRQERITEEGWAPPERIERVIEGVLARSGMEGGEPIVQEIGGRPDRWDALLESLDVPLDQG